MKYGNSHMTLGICFLLVLFSLLSVSAVSASITNDQDFSEQISEYQKAITRTSYMDVTLILRKDGSVRYINEVLKTLAQKPPEKIPILSHFKFNENDSYDKIEVYDLSGGEEIVLNEVTELPENCNNEYLIHLYKKELLVCKQPTDKEIHLKLDIIVDPEQNFATCRKEGMLKDTVFKGIHLNLGPSDHEYRLSLKEFGGEDVKLGIPKEITGNVPIEAHFTPIIENNLEGFKSEFIVPAMPNKFFTLDTMMVGEIKSFTLAQQKNTILTYISLLLVSPSILLSILYRIRKKAIIDRQSLSKIIKLLMVGLGGMIALDAVHWTDLNYLTLTQILTPIIISVSGITISALIMHLPKKRKK